MLIVIDHMECIEGSECICKVKKIRCLKRNVSRVAHLECLVREDAEFQS